MKLHYFFNGKVFIKFDQNYTQYEGYHYTYNEVKYYAKKHGWSGVKKVNYAFVEEAFRRREALHQAAMRRTD